ncbi:E3 ubiquitin-protein ligase HACE1 (HECT domain and ankyrin repeat-containing E3 ubiquitin-protein ligase 1) (HECT-type E3 ubiquitin transferase HACE1) [Durusdinium trenchii]|uniref:HECT-type E3 ubiquitin transferase n=1 Tax=Durusdinium trenchii TaxID=1381693 RepID=A0ABP0LY27_9DINO
MDLCGNEFVVPEMTAHLLQLGADATLRTRKQISALHELCSNNALPSARLLLHAKAEVNAMCSKGMTPLHCLCGTVGWIVCRDGVTNIQELLGARADATLVDTEGRTPSEVLCSQFYKRDELVLHGFHGPLCPEPLDAALKPLLLEEARNLTGCNFEKKINWFRGVLECILMYAPIADEYEALPLLQVDRKQVLQSICQQHDRLTPHMEDVMFGQETGQGAGLVKDLFSVFSSELSKEDYNLFVTTDSDPPRLAMSSRPCFNELRSSYYKLVGKMMSLALLKEQHLPVRFAKPLLKELLGLELCPEDLAQVDEALYKRLNQLRDLDAEVIRQLDLDFSVDEVHFGKRRRVSLTWNGEKMPVTKSNVDIYANLYAAYRLRSNEDDLSSLKSGFYFFIPQALILAASTCLKVEDFDSLLFGNDEIDVQDWKRSTKYDGPGAAERTKVVKWFWDAVAAMSNRDRRLLLRFVTGQSSSPIGGFKHLKSQDMSMPFTIVLKSKPEDRKLRTFYPTAATCSNLLQLPRYKSEADLKKYLAHVIQEEMMTFAELE